MNRGEIWWAELPEPQKSEPGYRRPLVIIQSDAFNQSKINTVICAIITSNLRLENAPGNFILKSKTSGLPKDSVVNVSQMITIDKSFLVEKVGKLTPKLTHKLNDGLRLVLFLN